jgi:transposase
MGHLPTKGLGSVTPWPYLRTTPPTRSSQNIPSETAWKIERVRSMTYAPEHGKVLCDRPHRRRRGCIEPHLPPPKAGEEDPKTHPPARSSTRSSSTSSKAAAPGGYYRGISPRVGNRLAWWFGRWRVDGTFERLNAALCERLRARLGRNPLPRAGIADSQSAKSTGVGGERGALSRQQEG